MSDRNGRAQSRLRVAPLTIKAAATYVRGHHRHLPAIRGGLFALGVVDDSGDLRGVAIVGRPTARMLQDGYTAEVSRVATDGTANACSALYGACRRAAAALGWRHLVTYTRADEPGTSLRAAGARAVASVRAGGWSRPSRLRPDRPTADRVRWQLLPGLEEHTP